MELPAHRRLHTIAAHLTTDPCSSAEQHATLYAVNFSLFSGRARSYLIKAGVPYREVTTSSAHFREVVLAKAGGRHGLPTLELADGTVIRDGAAIIDYFEAKTGHQFSPTTPKQRIVSRLFDVIGAEGMLRPAMHYRWNFPEENDDFLHAEFATGVPGMHKGMPEDERLKRSMGIVNVARQFCVAVGNNPSTKAVVEALYEEFMQKVDAHFAEHPYLLGARPCIGDFGMIAPLYAHLGRDPKPLSMMQARALWLYRWTERMNRPEPNAGAFEIEDNAYLYLPDDQIPGTLIAVLKHMAIDFVPETKAAAQCINEWLDAEGHKLPAGTPAERAVGFSSFQVRSTTINAIAQPYRFYLLKRVQDLYVELGADEQADVKKLLKSCDMEEILDITINRQIGLENNLEVWL